MYLYLDHDVIDEMKLNADDVARSLATVIEGTAGIGGAVPITSSGEVGSSSYADAVENNHHPERSGQVYVFQEPHWFLFDRGPIGVMHGSPMRYDTHVNIVFAGPGIAPANVSRTVHPVDVAPTLSALLGLPPPQGAEGQVLSEVVSND